MDGVQMIRMGKYYVMEHPRVIGICHYCREYVDTWNRMVEQILLVGGKPEMIMFCNKKCKRSFANQIEDKGV